MVTTLLPALRTGFLNDDISMISFAFDHWRPHLANIFSERGLMGLYYRPLIDLSFALDHALWGWNAVGFRLTNVLIHLGTTVFVYILGRKLAGTTAAFAGALLFALHPIHEMSILWVVGRTDLFCTLFLLGSLIACIGWWEKRSSLLLSLTLYVLALLSKEMAFSLPLLVPPTLWWLDRQNDRRRELRHYAMAAAPFVAVSLVVGVLRYLLLGNNLLSSEQGLHGGAGIVQVIKNIATYIGLLVVPFGHREIELLVSAYPPIFLAGAVVVLATSLLLLWRFRHTATPVLFWAVWVLITLLPVSRLMMRWYLYLPSVGFCLALGWLLTRSRSAIISGAALLVVYGTVTLLTELRWIEAGDIAATVLDEAATQVGPVSPGDTVVFLTIPSKLGTTPIYNLGLPQALRHRLGVDSLECLVWSRVVMDSYPARIDLAGRYSLSTVGGYFTINDAELMTRRKGASTGMTTTLDGAEFEVLGLDENNKISRLSITPLSGLPERVLFFDGERFVRKE